MAEPLDLGNVLQSDQVEQLPFVVKFWTRARQGQLLLWEPDIGAGVPLFGAVYNRILAPWNVAFLLFPAAKAAAVATAIAFFVAQLGMYGLARRFSLGPAASVVAAVIYAFSGPLSTFVLRIHEPFLLPALLYAMHGAFYEDHRRARYLALTAMVFASILLSGFPSVGLMCAYVATGWLVWLVWSVRRLAWSTALRRGLVLSCGLALGVLIAAVQLPTSYQFLSVTPALERSYPVTHSAGLRSLASVASGRIFGTFQEGDWWGDAAGAANPFEGSMTLGTVTLLLLTTFVARRVPSDAPRLEAALGQYLLPLGLLSTVVTYLGGPALAAVQLLPYMSENSLTRSRFLVSLALALVAGWQAGGLAAADRSVPTSRGRAVRLQVALFLGLLALAIYETGTLTMASGRGTLVLRALVVPACSLAGVVLTVYLARRQTLGSTLIASIAAVLVVVELQWGAWLFTPASRVETFYPPPELPEAVVADVGRAGLYRVLALPFGSLRPNSAIVHDISDVRAAWPTTTAVRSVLELADPSVYEATPMKTHFTEDFDASSPALDALSVRYLAMSPALGPLEAERTSAPLRDGKNGTMTIEGRPSRPVRAIEMRLAMDGACDRRDIGLRVGDIRTRRLVRDLGGWTAFHLPDVTMDETTPIEVDAGDCAVRQRADTIRLHLVDPRSTLEVVDIGEWVIYRRSGALPRVQLTSDVDFAPTAEKELAAVAARREGGPVVVGERLPLIEATDGTVRSVDQGPNHVRVTISADGPMLLVLRDAAAPGWRVTLDGKRRSIVPVDHAFRGVAVPPGDHTVEFRYRPPGLVWGASASLAAIAAVGMLLLRDRSRRLAPASPRGGDRRSLPH